MKKNRIIALLPAGRLWNSCESKMKNFFLKMIKPISYASHLY